MGRGATRVRRGYLLIAAFAALLLVPALRPWAWLIAAALVVASFAVAVVVVRENRARTSPPGRAARLDQ